MEGIADHMIANGETRVITMHGTITVDGRTAECINRLAASAAHVDLFGTGKVELHFKGKSLTLRVVPIIDPDSDALGAVVQRILGGAKKQADYS